MTSATVQRRKGGRRQASGQRVLALLKPLFWSLDNLLHLQEGALTVAISLFLERFFVTTSDLRVVLQIKTSLDGCTSCAQTELPMGACW